MDNCCVVILGFATLLFNWIFYFVDGQILEVISDSVTGERNGEVSMTWTMKKTEASYIVTSADLLLGKSTTGDVLFRVCGNSSTKKLAGTKVFGSRITGISNGSNLQYNGTVAFTFLVTITLADGVTFCGARAHLKTIVISKIKRYYQ